LSYLTAKIEQHQAANMLIENELLTRLWAEAYHRISTKNWAKFLAEMAQNFGRLVVENFLDHATQTNPSQCQSFTLKGCNFIRFCNFNFCETQKNTF